MKKLYLFLLAILISSISINAQISISKIFSDNMVLQRNTLIPVWGTAKANEKIEVRFNKQIKKTKADKNGKWMVRLNNETAGGPYNLIIKGSNQINFKNVLVGDVWLCSGQSNMEMPIGKPNEWRVNDFEAVSAAANFPMIRQIKMTHAISALPESEIKTSGWKICDPTTVGEFTAVGYFFAKIIHEKLKIPIGIINSSWGGTNIETWISREGFENSDEFKEMIATMPKVSLDSLLSIKTASTEKRIEVLQNAPLSNVKPENFNKLNFNDNEWPTMSEPKLWETQDLGAFDGTVWLRKHIFILKEDIKNNAFLEIPAIDDDDITFINDIKIGETNSWDAKRNYKISVGILRDGDNVIAIRIVDHGGGGGIYGNAENFKLNIGDKEIPLRGDWKYQVESINNGINFNDYPSLCYNAMINPLIPFAFKGVLWYQGESNAPRAYQYRTAFPLLISDWRQKWNNPNFPLYFVQLATFKTSGNSNEGCDWAELQEAQTMTLKVSNTGMAVTTDIGNPNDIHPGNKQDVGKRLAALALNNTYNIPTVCNGPMFKSLEILENKIIVSFENIGTGLKTPDKYGYIKGFEIAGEDQVFHYAQAFIRDNKVILSSEEVENPIAVRYSWIGDASESNLFNKEGFPAVPFRTDQWKTITKGVKYKIDKLN